MLMTTGFKRTQSAPSDRAWLNSAAPFALDPSYSRYPYRVDLAQAIRDAAGLQSGETAGNESGKTIGLTDAGALTTDASIGITNEGGTAFTALSGSGTEADPYVIRDIESVNEGVLRCLRIDDADADYHVKFVNCRWAGGTNAEIEIAAWPENIPLIFENCEIYDANSNGTQSINIAAGSAIFRNCLFSGDGGSHVIRFTSNTDMGGSFTFENCRIDDSQQAYGFGNFLTTVFDNSMDITFRHCTVDVTLGTGGQILNIPKAPSSLLVENCSFTGMLSLMNVDDGASTVLDRAEIRNCKCIDQGAEAIYHNYIHNALIEYCEFEHNTEGANFRLIYMEGLDDARKVGPENCTVQNCKFTQKVGTTDAAGNECLESARAKNMIFRWCWTTECVEDAFEHIYSIGGNTVEYCVGDNVEGQVVDIWKGWDAISWSVISDTENSDDLNIYVHHIYGDCTDIGCTAHAYRGGVYHDIYIDNSLAPNTAHASVQIRERDGTPAVNILVAGPLPLPADRKNEAVGIDNDSVNCEGRFFDNESGTGSVTIVTT